MFKFVQSRQKRKDIHRDEDESATEDESSENSASGSESESESDSDSEAEQAFGEEPGGTVLSASEIIASPLVPDDEDEDITRCLICPGKLLKSRRMVEVHESSHSHTRRTERFKSSAVELEAKTGSPPSLHAILYRMDTKTADLTAKPKPVKASKPTSSTDKPTATKKSAKPKPTLSRKEKKLARKAKMEAFAAKKAAGGDGPAEKDLSEKTKTGKAKSLEGSESKPSAPSSKTKTSKTKPSEGSDSKPTERPSKPPKKKRRVSEPTT